MALVLLIGVSTSETLAQDAKEFKFNIESASPVKWEKDFTSNAFLTSNFHRVLEELKLNAYGDGFIAFSAGFTSVDSSVCSVNLDLQYKWSNLKAADESKELIESTLGRRIKKNGQSFSTIELFELSKMLLTKLENTGYPFAQVFLDSVLIKDEFVSAVLEVKRGPMIRLDSIRLHGNLPIRKNYIENFLNLEEGRAYHEHRIKQSRKRLNDLSFATQVQPPQVTFEENSAYLDLYLNKRRANRFDGIVGFLPDQNGKILVTGDVQLHLENALKQGELLDVSWRKLQTNTQDFKVEAIAPFVLNSPVSMDGKLQIYRRDTLFSNVDRQLGLRYMIAGADYLRLFFSRASSSLLSTSSYESGQTLPPFLDKKMSSYGLGIKIRRLDYLQNPARGFEIEAASSIGSKEISRNNRLPEILYDSLNLKTLQWMSTAQLAYYVSPLSRVVWHQRFLGAHIMNDQLFNNEAYRIGGFRSMRGFDEESIFSTSYAILRSELRFQLDKDGYVFGFYDGAWFENSSLNRIGVRRDLAQSFGVGTSFGTTAGIFNLSYALGSQRGNPFLIRTAKIHFGYTSVF